MFYFSEKRFQGTLLQFSLKHGQDFRVYGLFVYVTVHQCMCDLRNTFDEHQAANYFLVQGKEMGQTWVLILPNKILKSITGASHDDVALNLATYDQVMCKLD